MNTYTSNFTLNPGQGNIPLTVQFMDNTQNKVTEWLWDFGDGSQSTAQHPKHTYFEAGDYTVRSQPLARAELKVF